MCMTKAIKMNWAKTEKKKERKRTHGHRQKGGDYMGIMV